MTTDQNPWTVAADTIVVAAAAAAVAVAEVITLTFNALAEAIATVIDYLNRPEVQLELMRLRVTEAATRRADAYIARLYINGAPDRAYLNAHTEQDALA